MLPDLLSTLLRGLSFIAVLQAGGAALFVAVLGKDIDASRAKVVRLACIAAIAAAVLLLAQYLLQPARMAGEFSGVLDPALQRLALHSPVAMVLLLRLAGLAVVVWGLRSGNRAARALEVLGAMAIAASFTLVGHTSGGALRAILAPLLLLHLLVVQFWFGALRPLVLVGRLEGVVRLAQVVDRFSRWATWLVPLILVAGVLLAGGLLPDVAALNSAYGAGLLSKTALFALLMALAAWNKWRLAPALATQGAAAIRRLERSIGIEYWLIALVLMGTAVLTDFWSPEN